MVLIGLFSLPNVLPVTIAICTIIGNAYYTYNVYIHSQKNYKNSKIIDMVQDLKKVEQSNVYIDDLIDNI